MLPHFDCLQIYRKILLTIFLSLFTFLPRKCSTLFCKHLCASPLTWTKVCICNMTSTPSTNLAFCLCNISADVFWFILTFLDEHCITLLSITLYPDHGLVGGHINTELLEHHQSINQSINKIISQWTVVTLGSWIKSYST